MNVRWVSFGALAFALAACSHSGGGSMLPQDATSAQSSVHSNAVLSSGASCAIVPGTTTNAFEGSVGGVSDSDAWNIYNGEPGTGTTMKFEHFTGSAWHSVTPPVIPNQSSYQVIYLFDVAAFAPNDVWTMGEAVGKVNGGTNRTVFFLHWNGIAWKYVQSDPALTNPYGMLALGGDASGDVWAVVFSYKDGSADFERWDGTKWSFVAKQPAPSYGIFGPTYLAVFGQNDVWALFSTAQNAFIVHWNGSGVSSTGLPYLNGNQPLSGSLAGTSDNDLWYATDNLVPGSTAPPYIAHRSSSWGLYNTSLVSGYHLKNVIEFRPGYVLIAGNDPKGNSALAVYNGYVRWRPTADPFPTTANTFNTSIVKGTTSFWTSFYTDQFGTTGLAGLIRCPSTPPVGL